MPRNSPMMSDAQWAKTEPLLSQLIARNGARWQDLPGAYPSPSTY